MSTRFYFNSENDQTHLDPEGIELADIEQAQTEALGLLGRMLQDTNGDGLWRREGLEGVGVRLQMHLDDLGGFGTEALTRWGVRV